jgi:hypothetical protein
MSWELLGFENGECRKLPVSENTASSRRLGKRQESFRGGAGVVIPERSGLSMSFPSYETFALSFCALLSEGTPEVKLTLA